MRQLNIFVTQEKINIGERNSCVACPVALSVVEALNDPTVFVSVTRDSIYIGGKRIALPENAKQLIAGFDAGWKEYVKPIKFTIHIPEREDVREAKSVQRVPHRTHQPRV